MAYNDPKSIHSRDSYVERDVRSTGPAGIALAVGGLIVAVLVLFWLFSGTGGPTADSAGEPAAVNNEATINPNPVTDQAAPAQTAPEAAPEVAPAVPENEIAPADGAAVGD